MRRVAEPAFEALLPVIQASLLAFEENSFAILPGFLRVETGDGISRKLTDLIASPQISRRYLGKFTFAYRKSARYQAADKEALRELMAALLGHETRRLQSINFLTGSRQPIYSDSIHMGTFSLGGMAASWVTLEDIMPGNGPLH